MSWFARVREYFNLSKPKHHRYGVLYAEAQELSKEPWASFEIAGFETDGRIKVKFNWNQSFIKKIKDIGFEAETDEDTVQLFFYTSSMRPTHLAADAEDGMVQPSAHPQLSQTSNEIRL